MESQDSVNSNRVMHFPTTICPHCKMIWLAPGLAKGDTYECKRCGLSFIVCDPSGETLQRSAKVLRTKTTVLTTEE